MFGEKLLKVSQVVPPKFILNQNGSFCLHSRIPTLIQILIVLDVTNPGNASPNYYVVKIPKNGKALEALRTPCWGPVPWGVVVRGQNPPKNFTRTRTTSVPISLRSIQQFGFLQRTHIQKIALNILDFTMIDSTREMLHKTFLSHCCGSVNQSSILRKRFDETDSWSSMSHSPR